MMVLYQYLIISLLDHCSTTECLLSSTEEATIRHQSHKKCQLAIQKKGESQKFGKSGYITTDFQYSDPPDNTVLSYAAPKSVIEFPENVVRILDTSQTLIDCKNSLVNFSFSSESKLENLGVKTFSYFSQLFFVDLRNCKRLTNIARSCFFGSSLKYILLPEYGSLTALLPGCFATSKLIEIKIPKTVQQIYHFEADHFGPFTHCEQLIRIDIPVDSQLTYIGSSFAQFSRISEFFIPENADFNIGALNNILSLSTYKLHENNTRYKLYKGILYSSDFSRLVECPCDYTSKIEIHENCSFIESEAFRTVLNYQDLIIPSNVKEIGKYRVFFSSIFNKIIFEDDSAQEDFYLDNGFLHCNAEVILPKTLRKIGSNIFRIYYGKSIEFFSNVEVIDANTFVECPNLEFIKFNEFNHACIIKKNAVTKCPKLKYIILPLNTASMIKIELYSFIDCPKLNFIKFTYDMTTLNKLFVNTQFINKTQISITSPHNSSCGNVHLSFPNAAVCRIEQFCTSSFHLFTISQQIFNICPFISM